MPPLQGLSFIKVKCKPALWVAVKLSFEYWVEQADLGLFSEFGYGVVLFANVYVVRVLEFKARATGLQAKVDLGVTRSVGQDRGGIRRESRCSCQ